MLLFVNWLKNSWFPVSLFDDIAEDQTNDDVEDDMADFIVDDEDVIYGKGDSLRYFPYTQFF